MTAANVIRPGRVVIVLNGKYAGKKAIIVNANEEGSASRPYGHALVVGIERTPLRVTKHMTEEKINKRSRVKPFMKVVNLNHIMLTRYAVDNLDFKSAMPSDSVKDQSKKKDVLKGLKRMLEERHATGTNRWFFQKLRF